MFLWSIKSRGGGGEDGKLINLQANFLNRLNVGLGAGTEVGITVQ